MLPLNAVLVPLALAVHDLAVECVPTTNRSGWTGYANCRVPFLWDGHMRYQAIANNETGVLECPMHVDVHDRTVDESYEWEDATCTQMECVTKYTEVTDAPAGTQCKFPFIEEGIMRWSCVTDDVWGQPPWCATSTDNSSNYGYGEWGYCDCHPLTTTRAPVAAPPPPPPGRDKGRNDERASRKGGSGGMAAVAGILSILCATGLFAFLFVAHRNGQLEKWIDTANEQYTVWHRDYALLNKYAPLPFDSHGDVKKSKSKEERAMLKPWSADEPQAHEYGATGPAGAGRAAPPAGKSSFWAEVDDVDWDELEAAATALRTCHIKKAPGEKLGLRLLNYSGPNFAGARVIMVNPGSPGEAAGIVEGDNIVEIGGQPIINMWHEEVVNLLRQSGNEFDIVLCRSTKD